MNEPLRAFRDGLSPTLAASSVNGAILAMTGDVDAVAVLVAVKEDGREMPVATIVIQSS